MKNLHSVISQLRCQLLGLTGLHSNCLDNSISQIILVWALNSVNVSSLLHSRQWYLFLSSVDLALSPQFEQEYVTSLILFKSLLKSWVNWKG